MDDFPENEKESVMQVSQENKFDLLHSNPPCEGDEKKEENGKDGKRKLTLECMSKPHMLKKVATEASEIQHDNHTVDFSDDPISCSPSKESSLGDPAAVQTTQECTSNLETTETTHNSETETQEPRNNGETSQECMNNGETKNASDCEKVQVSVSSGEATAHNMSNSEAPTEENINSSETSQKSGSECVTAKEDVSKCEFSPGEQHDNDEQYPKNDISEPRVLLTRVVTEEELSSDHSSSGWGSRLRVRRRRPPPPPSPPSSPEELYPPAKKERPVARTAALKKVNYCELYSSEEDEPKESRIQKSRRLTSSSGEDFSMSEENYSSDDSRSQRKKRAVLRKKEQERNSEGSDSGDDYKSQKREGRTKKIPKVKKQEQLSEYEQQRQKNIEEKMAFLESLKFDEMKEEILTSKKSKKVK